MCVASCGNTRRNPLRHIFHSEGWQHASQLRVEKTTQHDRLHTCEVYTYVEDSLKMEARVHIRCTGGWYTFVCEYIQAHTVFVKKVRIPYFPCTSAEVYRGTYGCVQVGNETRIPLLTGRRKVKYSKQCY